MNKKLGGFNYISSSDSIINQREPISLYIKKEKDLKVVDYYIDDGYSGTDFERPDFKRMIRDIKRGKIDTIIVKDMAVRLVSKEYYYFDSNGNVKYCSDPSEPRKNTILSLKLLLIT